MNNILFVKIIKYNSHQILLNMSSSLQKYNCICNDECYYLCQATKHDCSCEIIFVNDYITKCKSDRHNCTCLINWELGGYSSQIFINHGCLSEKHNCICTWFDTNVPHEQYIPEKDMKCSADNHEKCVCEYVLARKHGKCEMKDNKHECICNIIAQYEKYYGKKMDVKCMSCRISS